MKQALINLFTYTLLAAILLFMTVITGASKYMLIMITAAAVCDSVKGERNEQKAKTD
jgi:flagellar biosynthesis component FlhA